MTIAQAFNEIAVAQGGTANNSGTIAGAIDALNDALAGSDQPAAQSVEAAVRLLGEHINAGGGGGGWSSERFSFMAVLSGEAMSVSTEISMDGEVDEDSGYFVNYIDLGSTAGTSLPVGIYVHFFFDEEYSVQSAVYDDGNGHTTPFTDYTTEGTNVYFQMPAAPTGYEGEDSTIVFSLAS